MDFQKLTEKVFAYYAREKYNQALEVVQKAVIEYPKKLNITSYWAACLYTKLSKNKKAIDVLENTLNKGIWWSPKLLTEDPDLEPLYNKEEFKRLVSRCSELWKEKQSNSEPELTVMTPESYTENKKYPLLIILHGRNGNVNEFSKYWDIPYLREKYILAFPQSSQVFGINSYCWDGLELAKSEVKSHYKKLIQNYNVNLKNVILAGASQGGRLAIQLALEESNFCGFVGVIPAISDVDYYLNKKENWEKNRMKGVMIVGDSDNYYPPVKKLYTRFRELDYPIKIIAEEGLGHSISGKFPDYIKSALEFINDNITR